MYNVKFYWGNNKEFTRDIESLESAWVHDLNRAPTWTMHSAVQVYPQGENEKPFTEIVWVQYIKSTRSIMVNAFGHVSVMTRYDDPSNLVVEHALEELYNYKKNFG